MNVSNESTDVEHQRVYPGLNGVFYVEGLNTLHKYLRPEWYLEVGSFKGDSLKVASANSIAVDPKLQIGIQAYAKKKELHLFQMTSDDFFASNRASVLASHIDFAFLDGMHLFEYLLRDFINTEKLCKASSVIAMHDCVPITEIASLRDWDRSKTLAWTGDVWKLVPILKEYRPDLVIQVLDCPPSGLTVVSNLDPKNTVLSDNYDKIVLEYMEQTIGSFGKDRLLSILNIESSKSPDTLANIKNK